MTTWVWIAGASLPVAAVPSSPLLLADTPQTLTTVSYLFVHPARGHDGSGDGSEQAPLRTITQALRLAQSGTVIVLAPGTYSTVTGEIFPLQLKPGVSLQGDPSKQGQTTVITGGGFYLSPTTARQNITILGATSSSIVGVTITNTSPRGYGLWVESTSPTVMHSTFTANTQDGISITGNGAAVIRSNVFRRNGANGITVYGNARPEIRENTFEQTGFAINVGGQAAPRIVGNRITQNKDGIVVQAQAQPILRNNSIWGNARDGLVAIASARPNLGTSADPGGNLFSNNGRFDLNAQASNQAISAIGNQLDRDRLRGRLSLNGSGSRSPGSPAIATSPAATIGRSTPPPLRAVALQPVPGRVAPSNPTPTQIPRRTPAVVQVPPPRMTPSAPVQKPTIPAPPPLNRPPQVSRAPQPTVRPSSTLPPIGADAIVIAVPPPASPLVQRSLPPQRTVPQPGNSKRAALPAPSSTIPVLVPPKNIIRTPQNARVSSPGLLPVPSGKIPVGVASKNVPPPPAFSLAPGVRYRVIVNATDETQQAQVRSLVPNAFSSVSQGRRVLQVGAFSDRAKANELVQMLVSNGLAAALEEL